MAQVRLSLDELLTAQAAPPKLFVTIEALDDPEMVKVTPFNPSAQCACGSALKIRKDAVDWVADTGQVHTCCGQRLMIVEIGLKDATLADVLGQLAANARLTPQAAAPRAQAPYPDRTAAQRGAPMLGAPTAFRARRSLAAGGIFTPEEGGSGQYDPNTCEDARRMCYYWCRHFSLEYPSGTARCVCECDNDYYQCRDPIFYQRVDCWQQ
jgi:hypothetical protein